MAVNGFGAVIGSLYVAGSRRVMEIPNVLIICGAGFAGVLILFAITTIPWLAALFILAAGAISAVFMSVNNTLIQLNVDDAVRGRVLGIYVLTWGLLPVGTLPAGAIADAIGAPVALTVMSAVALIMIVLVAFRFPVVRGTSAEPTPRPISSSARN
jgi:MFS family permease